MAIMIHLLASAHNLLYYTQLVFLANDADKNSVTVQMHDPLTHDCRCIIDMLTLNNCYNYKLNVVIMCFSFMYKSCISPESYLKIIPISLNYILHSMYKKQNKKIQYTSM